MRVLCTILIGSTLLLNVCSSDNCQVEPGTRRDCGWGGITQEECRQRGCCFDSSTIGANWCFYKKDEKGNTPVAGYSARTGDCPGNDLWLFDTDGNDITLYQCADRCYSSPDCVAFLYSNSNGKCFPKSATCQQPSTDNPRNSFYDKAAPSVCHWEGTPPACNPGDCDVGDWDRDESCWLSGHKISCCVGNCPSGYKLKGRKCFKVFNILKNWHYALRHCQHEGPGGTLAMAKDAEMNNYLIRLKNKHGDSNSEGFWFGLSEGNVGGNSVWKWTDDTTLGPLSFNSWADNEPNGRDENCAELPSVGWEHDKWNDADCWRNRYFICEREQIVE